jgi:hypothetical protein
LDNREAWKDYARGNECWIDLGMYHSGFSQATESHYALGIFIRSGSLNAKLNFGFNVGGDMASNSLITIIDDVEILEKAIPLLNPSVVLS